MITFAKNSIIDFLQGPKRVFLTKVNKSRSFSLAGKEIHILILHYVLAVVSMLHAISETFRSLSRQKPDISGTPEKNCQIK